MYRYIIGEYDVHGAEATHEIEVHWPTGLVTPPVYPVGSWLIVEIHVYVDYVGDGSSSISYLVRRG